MEEVMSNRDIFLTLSHLFFFAPVTFLSGMKLFVAKTNTETDWWVTTGLIGMGAQFFILYVTGALA